MSTGQGWILAALLLAAVPAHGQAQPAATPAEAGRGSWTYGASAYAYFVPHDTNYVQPTVTADRDWLHLEARYNYEAQDTASVWVGYNLAGGDGLSWELTPILGGIFGEASGFAPGYEGTLGWWKLELSSEGEYFIDDDSSENYFYNWSELTFAVTDRFFLGVVTQRTLAYEAEREIERGLLAGFSFEQVDLTGYVFDPDDSDPTFVAAIAFSF